MSLTLAETEALDFSALFASLPRETQVRIGALAIEAEFLGCLELDAGLHADHEDQGQAEMLRGKVDDLLPRIVQEAFPELLPIDYDWVHPIWVVLSTRDPPATVAVRGMSGQRRLHRVDTDWFVLDGDRLVQLGGAADLDSREEGKPARLLFWTVEDIDAERLRLHPELAIRSECHSQEELDVLAA